MTKRKAVFRNIGYLIILIMFCTAICFELKHYNNYRTIFCMEVLFCIILSNIVHEAGHILFCIVFNCRITGVTLGVIHFNISEKRTTISDKFFLSGNCSFLISDGLSNLKKVLIFTGGIITNIILILILCLFIAKGCNLIFVRSLLCAAVMNVFVNGILPVSTDRKLIKRYVLKCKERKL